MILLFLTLFSLISPKVDSPLLVQGALFEAGRSSLGGYFQRNERARSFSTTLLEVETEEEEEEEEEGASFSHGRQVCEESSMVTANFSL